MLIFLNRFFVMAVEKSNFLPFPLTYQSTKSLVMNMAVNKEVTIPINRVVANPLIGPEPNTNSIKAVKPVVMLASKIEERAFPKPSAIAWLCPFPFANSSLIRSKISTLASTDIPMVNTIPAIPGRVSTAFKLTNTPKINKMFNRRAISAKIPAFP